MAEDIALLRTIASFVSTSPRDCLSAGLFETPSDVDRIRIYRHCQGRRYQGQELQKLHISACYSPNNERLVLPLTYLPECLIVTASE